VLLYNHRKFCKDPQFFHRHLIITLKLISLLDLGSGTHICICEKLSILPVRNVVDTFLILTNKEKMDTALQIGLDKQSIEHKDELIQLFMSIKGNV
jgi:hypothetical protein